MTEDILDKVTLLIRLKRQEDQLAQEIGELELEAYEAESNNDWESYEEITSKLSRTEDRRKLVSDKIDEIMGRGGENGEA